MQSLNDQPLVSVVIATYNMGQYLPAAVKSVCDGDYQSVEVIIIDDGSDDDSKSLLGDLLNDPRVRYIYQENAGQPKAKNAARFQSFIMVPILHELYDKHVRRYFILRPSFWQAVSFNRARQNNYLEY